LLRTESRKDTSRTSGNLVFYTIQDVHLLRWVLPAYIRVETEGKVLRPLEIFGLGNKEVQVFAVEEMDDSDEPKQSA